MGTLQAETLHVDDLLDFSCGDIGGPCEEGGDCTPSFREEEHDGSSLEEPSVSCSILERLSNNKQEASELLCLPPEELADELEWLSTFVEESYRSQDRLLPRHSSEQWFCKGGSSRKEGWCAEDNWSSRTTSWLRMDKSCIFYQILDVGSSPLIEMSPRDPLKLNGRWDKRGRSKRCSRSGGRVWSLQTVVRPKRPQEEEEEEEDEEHSQTSSLDYEPFYYQADAGEERSPSKKKAKKEHGRCGGGGEEGRRCSHCQVQKTPQWRAGPLGPKTLCNACGVRFKSGRLLPEYRPAASPTFVTDLHSNSHKKVLEMRHSKFDPTSLPFPQEEQQLLPSPRPDQEEPSSSSSSTCSQESIISSLHPQC